MWVTSGPGEQKGREPERPEPSPISLAIAPDLQLLPEPPAAMKLLLLTLAALLPLSQLTPGDRPLQGRVREWRPGDRSPRAGRMSCGSSGGHLSGPRRGGTLTSANQDIQSFSLSHAIAALPASRHRRPSK